MSRAVIFRLTAALGALLLALGGAELLIRYVDLGMISHLPPSMHVDPAGALHRLSHDPALGYELRPSVDTEFQGVQVHINSLGCRGEEPTLEPRPDLLIVSVGDSIAFGASVEEPDTFAARVQDSLRRRGLDATVLNCGVSGYNLDQSLALYNSRLARLKPDILIVNLWSDDLQPRYQLGDFALRSKLRERSMLFRAGEYVLDLALRGQLRNLPAGVGSLQDALDAAAERGGAALRALRRGGQKVLVVVHPSLNPLSSPHVHMTEPLRRVAESTGGPWLDVERTYAAVVGGEQLPELSIHPEGPDPHPAARGHRLIGVAVVSELQNLGWIEAR